MKRTLAVLAATALIASACGGSDEPAAEATSPAPPQDLESKPEVVVPDGEPPATLVINDLVVGEGDEATKGTRVTVHYVGVAYSTGAQFDASWDRAEPFPFALGGGQVIQGWDEGVAGMRVGGRRELIIPPAMAYGAAGVGPIGPNETLIFVVDLLAVS